MSPPVKVHSGYRLRQPRPAVEVRVQARQRLKEIPRRGRVPIRQRRPGKERNHSPRPGLILTGGNQFRDGAGRGTDHLRRAQPRGLVPRRRLLDHPHGAAITVRAAGQMQRQLLHAVSDGAPAQRANRVPGDLRTSGCAQRPFQHGRRHPTPQRAPLRAPHDDIVDQALPMRQLDSRTPLIGYDRTPTRPCAMTLRSARSAGRRVLLILTFGQASTWFVPVAATGTRRMSRTSCRTPTRCSSRSRRSGSARRRGRQGHAGSVRVGSAS